MGMHRKKSLIFQKKIFEWCYQLGYTGKNQKKILIQFHIFIKIELLKYYTEKYTENHTENYTLSEKFV